MREETRCRHIGYSFRLAARVILYASSHRQDNNTAAFVTLVVEHWLEREIAQWVHPMKDRSDYPSHHERMLLSRSYISLHAIKENHIDNVCPFHIGQDWTHIYIHTHTHTFRHSYIHTNMHTHVTKNVLSASLNKTFPSFIVPVMGIKTLLSKYPS